MMGAPASMISWVRRKAAAVPTVPSHAVVSRAVQKVRHLEGLLWGGDEEEDMGGRAVGKMDLRCCRL